MNQPPIEPMPVMVPYHDNEFAMSLMIPAIWEMEADGETLIFSSIFYGYEDNYWDTSLMYAESYNNGEYSTLDQFIRELNADQYYYQSEMVDINGQTAYIGDCVLDASNGEKIYNKVVAVQTGSRLFALLFYSPEEYRDAASIMFQEIINSLELGTR